MLLSNVTASKIARHVSCTKIYKCENMHLAIKIKRRLSCIVPHYESVTESIVTELSVLSSMAFDIRFTTFKHTVIGKPQIKLINA